MAETVRDEITQLARSIRALERQLEAALAMRRVELTRGVLGVHARYGSFVDCGDGDAYRHELERLRAEARAVEPT